MNLRKNFLRLLFLVIFLISLDIYSPLIESALINYYRPRINNSGDRQNNELNNWNSVKYITLLSLIRQFFKDDVNYQALLVVPSLKMNVPIANATNNDVYQFGGGMLIKRKLDSEKNIIVGAHNLGPLSSALFSPFANHQLIDRKVFITDFKLVKEYKIRSVQIIFPNQVSLVTTYQKNCLTMLTCTNDNKKRVLIKANLRKTYRFSQLSPSVKTFLVEKHFRVDS